MSSIACGASNAATKVGEVASAAGGMGKAGWDKLKDAAAMMWDLGKKAAVATWALDDTVIDTQWNITIRGASFYTDEYVKEDGEWRIKTTGYRRSFEELQPRAEVAGLRLTASWWATDGRSELPAG